MHVRKFTSLLTSAIVVGILVCGCSKKTEDAVADPDELLAERDQLDQTVWAPEVDAQRYETVFIDLWDRLRTSSDPAGKFAALAGFPFTESLNVGTAREPESLDLGIKLTTFDAEKRRSYDQSQWRELLGSIEAAGVRIVQTEWHHSRFEPSGPSSTITFSIHAIRSATRTTFALEGELEIKWLPEAEDPSAQSITVTALKMQQRSSGGLFRPLFTAKNDPGQFASAHPILVYDLDGDGLSEITLPRWNRVYRNRGGRNFDKEDFLAHPIPLWEAGILSDFDGDGVVDFVSVGKDGLAYIFHGGADGRFPTAAVRCAEVKFDLPSAITAGDVDGDGDLDLWMCQYKLSFNDGQMPTPFYDANDGYNSYFLLNDGNGKFTDATESAGLAKLRKRRSYSASFVDLDADGDLDLLNVSDYAGLDIYDNTGGGNFTLATDDYVDERHFFGMGHTLGDYNNDGKLDFYVIGMSSTTARRLDRLKLGRDDRPDVHQMRAAMGYGNRMYFGSGEKKFIEDREVAAAVARTGWSWGATSFDFDLDGDLDIYVANGHRSGKSCEDYCSTFWRHDIYTGDSIERPEVVKLFQATLDDINRKEISWNGYEKNVLFTNDRAKPSRFMNSAFQFGTAYQFDSRSVVADDLDADGRQDLIMAESIFDGRGFALSIHVYANEIVTERSHNWFAVRLAESVGAGHSPNGAKVEVTDDRGVTQSRWIVSGDSFLAQHAPVAHFGLGEGRVVKLLKITWPNGEVQSEEGRWNNMTKIVRGG
ncbi:MAG: hypothetical protein ACI8XO_004421 [Verrucomicrobiales bacterium]|jgi:hypothetical protein